ncbi:response regulator transcription factor [Paenibacillus flagellatus]|uniref:DNA-binding response regulator n=1 Tax=Paenibacillus flagellatus TaxID=2211139 RepID=A0A2V5JWA9_9BACL|nr:response regulator transcription factor [Paenibacillus flagellatus]PYI51049.1 DNA-binding response regulator [Paenibacillus flagellatus]
MKTILFVEDDESLQYGVSFTLQREGWRVASARSIGEARERFRDGAFDLLLLDNRLPDGFGIDLCRDVRSRSTVPVIFLTASDEEVNIVLGLESGADDYITKPFRVQELVSRIRAAFRRADMHAGQAAALDGDTIRSGPVTVDLARHQVRLNGVETAVSPTEFKLLAALVRHPQQTLTRRVILERLWDAGGEFIDDNTLSVHIRRLREKIEPDPSAPVYIVTVRGVGYKWDARSERS